MEQLKDRGRDHFQKGEYSRAIDCYTKAIDLDKSDHILFSNRSACHLKLGNHKAALDDALVCTQRAPLWPKGYSRLGDALYAMDRKFSALRWFKNGLRMDPANTHLLEMVRLIEKELPEGAEDDEPGSPNSNSPPYPVRAAAGARAARAPPQPRADKPQATTIESLKEEGNKAFQAGDYTAAVESYSVALEVDGSNAKLLSNRSACYCLLGRHKKALDDANRVVHIAPKWAKGYSRRGDALQAMNCLRSAISAYTMGLEFDSENVHMKEEIRKLQVELDALDKQQGAPKPTPTPTTPTTAPAPVGNAMANGYHRKWSQGNLKQPPPQPPQPQPQHLPVNANEAFRLHPSARTETVTKHWYEWASKKWYEKQVTVQLEEQPFDEGSMRLAFRMHDLSMPPGSRSHVAKVFKPGLRCGQEQIWADVEMYEICSSIASAFNSLNPPKKVSFCHCFLISRASSVPRHRRIMFVEPYLRGTFKKYNNNDGWCSGDDRNTPHAFSHFSYEHTRHEMLVVDIQGVGDVYTDPQIHTQNGQDFGPGNCGREGISRFFATHVCNPVCHFLKLPTYRRAIKEGGTAIRQGYQPRKS